MAVETEIKVSLASTGVVREQLAPLGCSLLSSRHFEDNYLLDFADGRLKERMLLLRVRLVGGKAWLTYKGPPRPEGIFKVREELEISVEDGSVALRILENLDLRVWFRYQKYREEYAVPVPGESGQEIHLALDETPIGTYAEFEGAEEAIRATASALGFDESKFVRASYYSLYLQYCGSRGEVAGHMVFPGGEIAKNLAV